MELNPSQTKMGFEEARLDLALWEVKAVREHKTHLVSCFLRLAGGKLERKARRTKECARSLASFLPVCAPCVSAQYLKTTHARLCYSQLPGSWHGNWKKHLWRTIKRAWLVVRAVSKCWQIVIFNEYTALEWPIKRSLSDIAPLFRPLIFYATAWYLAVKQIFNTERKSRISQSTWFFVHCFLSTVGINNHRNKNTLLWRKWNIWMLHSIQTISPQRVNDVHSAFSKQGKLSHDLSFQNMIQ